MANQIVNEKPKTNHEEKKEQQQGQKTTQERARLNSTRETMVRDRTTMIKRLPGGTHKKEHQRINAQQKENIISKAGDWHAGKDRRQMRGVLPIGVRQPNGKSGT
jgi:hypothetical protein